MIPHFITVTAQPTEDSDDFEFTLGGDHDYLCQVWYECRKDWHRHPKSEEYRWEISGEWSTKRVPETHQWLDDFGWCVHRPGDCGYYESDKGELWYELEKAGAQVGERYRVHVEWDGDWWLVSLGEKIDD